jgi:hypothetical protein
MAGLRTREDALVLLFKRIMARGALATIVEGHTSHKWPGYAREGSWMHVSRALLAMLEGIMMLFDK